MPNYASGVLSSISVFQYKLSTGNFTSTNMLIMLFIYDIWTLSYDSRVYDNLRFQEAHEFFVTESGVIISDNFN